MQAAHPFDISGKVLDKTAGIVRFTASDPSIDSYGEIIDPDGWKFDERWDKNPVIVNSHQYEDIRFILGRGVRREVVNKALEIDVEFAINIKSNEAARAAFEMIEGGFLRGCSVGFKPVDYAFPWGDPKKWQDAVALMARKYALAPADIAKLRGVHLVQQLSELSVCVLGANSNALAKAFKAGAITEERLDGVCRQFETLRQQISAPETAPTTGPASDSPASDATRATVSRDALDWLRKLQPYFTR